MNFNEWFSGEEELTGETWKDYLNEIIEEGCIRDSIDIEVYMWIAYNAGQNNANKGNN